MKAFVFAALVAYAAASKQPGALEDDTNMPATEMSGDVDAAAIELTEGPLEPEIILDAQEEPILDAQEDDWTIDEATDFKDNKVAKKDYKEQDWTGVDLDNFKFSDLMDLLNSEEAVADLSARVRTSFMDYYSVKVEDLPEVCEGGKKCRQEIRETARLAIVEEWNLTLKLIKSEINNTLLLSRTELETSYQSAFLCDHGCECEFIENRYAYIKTQIEETDKKIREREGWINDVEAQITAAWVDPCDFTVIKNEYEAEWEIMEEDHDAQINALADWQNDGFDMNSMVDQDEFTAKYGFAYDSSRFDKYYNA